MAVWKPPPLSFCATKAALRVATIDQAKAEATQIILANTYHLLLQPGADVVERLGGIREEMSGVAAASADRFGRRSGVQHGAWRGQ
jgi:tRNA-guanine family transglycosylase